MIVITFLNSGITFAKEIELIKLFHNSYKIFSLVNIHITKFSPLMFCIRYL
jgi:hypothetical protein